MTTRHKNNGERPPTSLDSRKAATSLEPDKPTVLGTGLIALDVVVGPQLDAVPRYWAGGTCGNVLTILAYLGWHAYPAASIGDDTAAEIITADMKCFGVQMRFLTRDATRHTPIVVEKIRVGRDGSPRHRFIWHCPSCGAWLPGHRAVLATHATVVAENVPLPKVFFFDRVSRGALYLARASAARGALVVFEPNGIKTGALFDEALQLSHIVKYSRERMGPFRALDKCASLKLQIETLGDDGLRYRLSGAPLKSEGWKELAPYPIADFKDAAGAGDWCTAGIIHSLGSQGAAGLDEAEAGQIEDALNLGQALAALKCCYEGPRGVMYSLKKKQIEISVQKILEGGSLPMLTGELNAQVFQESLKAICPSCPQKVMPASSPAKKLLGE